MSRDRPVDTCVGDLWRWTWRGCSQGGTNRSDGSRVFGGRGRRGVRSGILWCVARRGGWRRGGTIVGGLCGGKGCLGCGLGQWVWRRCGGGGGGGGRCGGPLLGVVRL